MTIDSSHMVTPVSLPGSKSIAARALVCRLLSGHDTRIGNLPVCGDTDGMLRLTQAVRDASKCGEATKVNIGEGGTTLRFGMAACASIPGLDITLVGSPRLMSRPHAILLDALRSLGAQITPLPEETALHIKGKLLTGGEMELDGSVSSQYLSAMMLAAPTWEKDTLFLLKKPVVSFPYITMTAGVMREFGGKVSIEEDDLYVKVNVKAHGYAQCARYDVEGDWSAASYFFETKLIQMHNPQFSILNSQFSILNSQFLKAPAESLQGDSRVAAIFAEAERRVLGGESKEERMVLNLNNAPDLVPAIAVGFCLSGVHFRIEGIAHLRHKESDRMAALQAELRKLGYLITCGDDYMMWNGERCEADILPVIKTYQDHRMAMAFAPAKLLYPNMVIQNPEVVEKSFPSFWQEISKALDNAQHIMHNTK